MGPQIDLLTINCVLVCSEGRVIRISIIGVKRQLIFETALTVAAACEMYKSVESVGDSICIEGMHSWIFLYFIFLPGNKERLLPFPCQGNISGCSKALLHPYQGHKVSS